MSESKTKKGIYLGDRGQNFRMFIERILKTAKLNRKYIDILLLDSNLTMYGSAFTSELVDETNNYQFYEQLGDLTGNKFIVGYIYTRFPFLKCAEGVKVAARLRINYGSKTEFAKMADKLGFWPYISATLEARETERESLLEDTFEAFLGVTESILDATSRPGVGYTICYKILQSMYDEVNFSLVYQDLYDAKTRLKELFDLHGEKLGQLKYSDVQDDVYVTSYCSRRDPFGAVVQMGIGRSKTKPEAQQIAAEAGISFLRDRGYTKHPPAIYGRIQRIQNGEDLTLTKDSTTTVDDVETFLKRNREIDLQREIGDRSPIGSTSEARSVASSLSAKRGSPEAERSEIDVQVYTRGKSKYRKIYSSTMLGMYCRKRDLEGITICLDRGADPNCTDSEGLTCTDLLLLGSVDTRFVKTVFRLFRNKVQGDLKIAQNVFEGKFVYYRDDSHRGPWFKKFKLLKQ